MKPKNLNTYQLTLGALYVALFALASNVPFLSAIQIIPGIPVTLQTFLIAMMGLTLGLRGGLMAYAAVLILTFCGLPMMSGGRGGPAVFFGPTCGYIYGWVFLVLLLGLYSALLFHKMVVKTKWIPWHIPVSFAVGMAGIGLDYCCGSLAFAVYSSIPLSGLPALLLSNLAYLPGDAVKIGLASVLSYVMFTNPVYKRMLHLEKAQNCRAS